MDTPRGYARVDLRRDRASEVLDVDSWGFAFTPPAGERETLAGAFEFDRGRGIEITDAYRGAVGSLVAVHTSIPHAMRVPGGGTVATSGLTWVAVHPGHRRRGLMSTMVDDHVERSLSRGEPVSTLFAAESQIYQRFGYGNACPALSLDLGRRPAMRELAGARDLRLTLDSADLDTHIGAIRTVQQRIQRPGTMVEFSDVTARDLFIDLESERDDAEQLRIAIVEDYDGPAAFALFRRKGEDDEHFGKGTTTVRTWGAAHASAQQRLFTVLSDLDLMAKTKVFSVPPDDPLLSLLVNMGATKPHMGDNLWLRILDVPAALEARRYARDCTVGIEVADPLLPENTHIWTLSIVDGQASVTRAERGVSAHVRLGIQELSAAYLGGVTMASLARAGLVDEVRLGAVDLLSDAMRGDQLPVGNISF